MKEREMKQKSENEYLCDCVFSCSLFGGNTFRFCGDETRQLILNLYFRWQFTPTIGHVLSLNSFFTLYTEILKEK